MLLYKIYLRTYIFLNLSIVIFGHMIVPSSKYANFNTKFVDSMLQLTVNNSCLPKEIILKEGVIYHPGNVQNILVTNILGFIVWVYVCGGSASMD